MVQQNFRNVSKVWKILVVYHDQGHDQGHDHDHDKQHLLDWHLRGKTFVGENALFDDKTS